MKILLAILAFILAAPAQSQILDLILFKQHAASSTAATPTFSPVAGTYSSTQTVTISSTTSLAVLCYTTDGSTPTETANLCSGGTTATYSTPISVSTTQTVKAIATLAGYTDSAVGSAAYTISAGGPSPNSGTGTVCQFSSGSALTYTYTPAAVGDAFAFTFAQAVTGAALVSVTDTGGSTYVLLAKQSGTARTGQNGYTLSLHSGVTHLTFTPTTASAFGVCGQEFANVSAISNYAGATFTGGSYSGTQLTITLANTTDYLYLGGAATGSVSGFTTGPNGTLVGSYKDSSAYFIWAQYVLNAQGTGTLSYTGGSVNLMGMDIQ